MNFLEELYYGNITPNIKDFSHNKQYLKAMDVFIKNEKYLSEQLKGEKLSAFIKLINANDEICAVAAAVKAYIATDTSGFAPAISQIKDRLRRMHASEKELTAGAAWALVSKAADDGYYNSYKQFQKLPETVRKALGGNHQILREYSLMDVRTFESVVKSQFIREYNAVIERENESAMLPEHIRSCFPCFDDSLDIGMIGDGYENKSSDI